MSKILHTSPFSFNGLRPEMVIAELGITDIQFKNEDIMSYAQKVCHADETTHHL